MKVVLLLVAVYALIINQALKQVDSKQTTNKKGRNNQQAGRNMYMNPGLNTTDPLTDAETRQPSNNTKTPVSPGYLFQRENDGDQSEPQNLIYPINYSYPVNLDKRRS